MSQEVSRDKNVCRKRIKTHLATNQKPAEIRKIDEEKLIRDHKGAKFLKHLAVNKQYLYELLLKSLAHF